MPSGQLIVTPVTLRGLAESGYADCKPFFGCFIVPTEKHRTRSESGPEPQWNHPLFCNVPENHSILNVEIVNEDPARPGVLGGAQIDLTEIFRQGHAEQWITIVGSSGQFVGQVLVNLVYTREDNNPNELPPAYSGPPGYPQEKPPSYHTSLGPEQPMPPSYGAGAPPPFVPPSSQFPPSAERGSAGSSQSPATPNSEGEKSRDWKTYGGAALAGAAAIGLGAWAAHEFKEHQEKKKDKNDHSEHKHKEKHKKKKHEKRHSHDGSSSSSDSD